MTMHIGPSTHNHLATDTGANSSNKSNTTKRPSPPPLINPDENTPLIRILQQLVRKPLAQAELCPLVELSRPRINFYVKNLLDLGLITYSDLDLSHKKELLSERGLNHQGYKFLTITPDYCYFLRILHGPNEFTMELLSWGNTKVLAAREGTPTSSLSQTLGQVKSALQEMTQECEIPLAQVKLILFATKGTVEQGFEGMMYRNNVISGSNIALAEELSWATSIPCYVCNYAFGHLLAMLHDPFTAIDNAILLSCGDGSVALGVYLNGQILFGPRNSFLECSHLPFAHGFEESLGHYGPHTEEALFFAITTLAPLFGMQRIIVAGPTFQDSDNAASAVRMVLQRLAKSDDVLLQRIIVDYRQKEITNARTELAYFASDLICVLLNPQPIKKNIASLFSPDDL